MPMPFNIFLGAVFLKDYQKSGQDRKIIATDIQGPIVSGHFFIS